MTTPPSKKRQKTDDSNKDESDKTAEEVEWRLYHPKKQKSFKTGDYVIILPPNNNNNNSSISKDPEKASSNQHQLPRQGTVVAVETHAVQVSIKMPQPSSEQETIKFSKREWKRLIPSFSTTKNIQILITPETNFFRHLAYQTNPYDKLLEIGCSTGETSRLLIKFVDSWVGLDTSDEMIATCRAKTGEAINDNENDTDSDDKNKRCHVAKADALVDPATALKEATTFGDPTVVFVDIGGNRECINVVRMLAWVLDTFPSSCRMIVVKSRELVQSIRSSPITTIIRDDVVLNARRWFLEQNAKRAFPKHPLRAPLVVSPKDGKTPICRYHNYHKQGCCKGDRCELDHEHCHACQQLGHIAKDCPTFSKSEDAERKSKKQVFDG
jgi:SAM-dependent methyltransferase